MADVIYALETSVDQPGTITQQAILWVPVPEQYRAFVANPNATSALTGTNLEPTDIDYLAYLKSGQFREVEVTVTVPMQDAQGEPLPLGTVLQSIADALDARYEEESDRIRLANPYVLRGSTRDVSGEWTVRSVAPAAVIDTAAVTVERGR